MNNKTLFKRKASLLLRHYYPCTKGRSEVEAYIASRFSSEHGARINEFMPHLLAVYSQDGEILAATGIRSGAEETLFLESYLDQSIEGVLAKNLPSSRKTPGREHIVEIGNLASNNISASRFLFRELFKTCRSLEYRWVVFTSCQRLCRAFKHLELSLIKLADAKEAQLSNLPGQWGTYYHDKPSVMAGYLPDGMALLTYDSQGGASHV